MKKELRAWLFLLAWIAVGTSPVVYAYLSENTTDEVWIESTEDVLRFDMEEVLVEPLETEKPELVSLGEFRLTAFCACGKCTDGDGLTALNKPPIEGRTVAVDPSVIPYGTIVVINGHEYVAEDNGGKWIKGNQVDIYFESHEDAKVFGIQYAEVFIKNKEE